MIEVGKQIYTILDFENDHFWAIFETEREYFSSVCV